MRSIAVVVLLSSLALGCAGADATQRRRAADRRPSCLAGEAFVPGATGAPILWAEAPGIFEGAPEELLLPTGYVESELARENLWIGTLRQRGGDIYLPAGATQGPICRRFRLEPDTVDQGWMTSDQRLEDGSAGRRDVRYSFRQTTTGFLDRASPDQSTTVTQLLLSLDGAYYRTADPSGTDRLLRAHGCHDDFRVVDADDRRVLVVRGAGAGAVRAYPRDGALTLFLNAAECERSLPRPPP